MREVFILGTSHSLQCGVKACRSESISALKEEIKRILSKHGIRRIAEEMSVDGLTDMLEDEKPCRTVCQRIAGDDIPVVFVDLGDEERAKLSLSNSRIDAFMFSHGCSNSERVWLRQAFSDLVGEVRERVWVSRILSGAEWPVLFVCGADHTATVRALFTRVRIRSTVIHRDFDPEEYPWMTTD